MISFKNFHIVIKTIFEENLFNIEEYQDKYYFKKKVQEYFPNVSDNIIFDAIDSFNKDTSIQFQRQRPLQQLSQKLYPGIVSCYERRVT